MHVGKRLRALRVIGMHLQLDTVGGIAGDMFIAAVLDAWPEHAEGVLATIRAAGLPSTWQLSIIEHRDHVLGGKRFDVREPAPHAHGDGRGGKPHIHGPHGGHTPFRRIVGLLEEAPLEPPVRARANEIFRLLAEAEAAVHGVDIDDVTFHEVGSWDSIADIVGAAYLLETLKPSSWAVGPLPLGGGRVATAHGAMPVPAPATTLLLKGFTVIDDGIAGERVTPTGAAILSHLRTALGSPTRAQHRPLTLTRSGNGFGTRTLPGISNVLRIIFLAEPAARRADDRVGVIQFEVDDQTAEDLAIAVDALRAHAGVLDVIQVPALGKKGRLVSQLQVLCRLDALDDVAAACFVETTTIGLRWTTTGRATLDRTIASIDAGDRAVAVKIAARPGQRTAKAEIEHSLGPGGHEGRRQRRASAEARALHDEPGEDA